MKLTDKGSIVAPPVLAGWAQPVLREIQSWPNVICATHWLFGNPGVVDGADFYIDDHELGHIHLDGEIHLVLTKAVKQTIIESGYAEAFRWDKNFVQFRIRNRHSAQHALWLFELSYDQIRGESESVLIERIALANPFSENEVQGGLKADKVDEK